MALVGCAMYTHTTTHRFRHKIRSLGKQDEEATTVVVQSGVGETTHFNCPEATSLAAGRRSIFYFNKSKKIQCIEAALPLQGGLYRLNSTAVYTEG